MSSLSGRIFRLSFCFSSIAGTVFGEAEALRGRVLDAAGAAIPGAQVRAASEGRTTSSTVQSGPDGVFHLALDPGKYTLRIVKDGFAEWSQTVAMPRGESTEFDIELQISPARATVTVTESAGYLTSSSSSATKTLTPLRDIPQSITVVSQEQMRDQMMMSLGDVVRYVPGITAHQGENNRDQVVIRGNNSSADFFVNGVRDDVQYYRDLYNLDRVEALKGPNAMIFGRGGAGGVINRVTKEAGFTPLREISLQGGSFGNKRIATDLDRPLGSKAAFRMNAMYENSDGFRRHVNLERYGISPTLAIIADERTKIALNYEHFRDYRTSDRGIPSFQGRPADTSVSTFFGNPNDSHVRAAVNLGGAAVERQAGRLNLRNRTHFGAYDRGYQNFVPGAVTPDKALVAISAYNNATNRLNIFNQTDLSYVGSAGRIRHTLLIGAEAGRQITDNFRSTGYFANNATSILAPYGNPVIGVSPAFRQSATDADNHLKTNVGAAYVQDQVELSRHVQLIAGLRFDHFDLQYRNNRNGDTLRRIDNLVSPRAGVVFKPVGAVSLYGSYSVSYLPSSGDQFSSLTTITQQVKPEKFGNYEAGIKWDLGRSLSITAAIYRLNRTNTRSTDPNDPTRIVQTGSQRTNGFEAGASGSVTRKWKIAGGYAHQDAFVTSATAAARAGAQVALVPHSTFSLWNNYQIFRRIGAGLGVLNRSDMFAAIDNTVILPRYTRADAAVFFSLTERTRLQVNVENVFDRKYYLNADSNTNISPGFPRAFRAGLIVRF
ncbi:MAG: TonB-dependent siderophore receptor [Bryobacterales bacterium]|nr:TonB-dependent siderophore receptor [Bryobacterales bacterium]